MFFTRHLDAADRPWGNVATLQGTGDTRGFTLVEVSIILMVVAVLSLILLPGIGGYLRDARLARARGDIDAIAQAVIQFLKDTGEGAFRCLGNGNRETADGYEYDPSSPDPFWVVGMLVSDGDTPDGGSEISQWRRPVDGHTVDTMANHLVQNTPGNGWRARYRTPADLFTGAPAAHFAFASQMGGNARFAWRGPYLSAPVHSDPWGNRYAINVRFLDARSASDGDSLSAYLAGRVRAVGGSRRAGRHRLRDRRGRSR